MEPNQFTMLWWILPYINMNHLCVYMCPTSLYPILPSPSPPTPLGCPKAPAF